MLNDLKELIAIRSVMGEPAPEAPFGAGPREALDCFLRIASSYGLRTHDEHGYCGWAEIGEGDGMIGILGHLDVVPAGEGWSHPPYSLVCQDGLLYGRGVTDDKGPTIAALHALVNLKKSGAKLKNRIRLIVGCNEENGSQCIEYYRDHCEIPKASFVPDADFPIINSEKGILHLSVSLDSDGYLHENISSLKAGERPNVVPDFCGAEIPKGSELYEKLASFGHDNSIFSAPEIATIVTKAGMRIEDYSVHFYEDKLVLEARGVAGHAMAPDKGENAAMKIFALLAGISGGKSPVLEKIERLLVAPNPADKLGIAQRDEVSGRLTVNLGIVRFTGGKTDLTLDCRLPVCADSEEVVATISRKLGAEVKTERWSPNLYIPESDPLVQALLEAYEEVTGNKPECLHCGGGTYARELPNAVAFGPTFPDLETNIHNIDESFPVELFDKLPEIYRAAILKLDERY